MSVNIRLAQKVMLEILLEIDRSCKKYNINYWLDHGTLLGAVRHKGFIPWDDDLDISMLRNDYFKFLEIAKKELDDNFFLQLSDTDKYYKNFYAKIRFKNSIYIEKEEKNKNIKYHQGIFVDIFPVNCIKYNKAKEKIYKNLVFLSKLMHNRYIKNISLTKYIIKLINNFHSKNLDNCDYIVSAGENMHYVIHVPKEYVFPLKYIEFEGYKFPVPNKYNLYLESIFGKDYMILSPKEKRKSHAIKIEVFK